MSNPYGSTEYRNPGFSYPDDSVRFLNAQQDLDNRSGSLAAKRSFKIQRGYIRNLQPATVENLRLSRCYFQFNPQEIRQNVQMREDIYNPVLLSPEQLSQPIGGNVSFQFDLLFDRSRELAMNTRGPVAPFPNEFSDNDPVNKAADQIGVFADLKVLYSVIGQGLSEQTIDLQMRMLQNTYNAKVAREAAYSESSTEGSSETTTDDTSDPFSRDFTDRESVRELFQSNIGNAAFLMPNPVRIVFSNLLMVDGFVTGTAVDFLKFNNDMIPMQCRVGISVNALYIGFAKKKTFLSTTIDEAREVIIEENKRDTAALLNVEKAVSGSVIKPFRSGFGSIALATTGWNTDWSDALRNGNVPGCELYYYLMPNSVIENEVVFVGGAPTRRQRVGFTGFPGIIPRPGEGKDTDPVLTLFEDPNTKFTVKYDWGFKIYASPTQNNSNGVGWTQSQASQIAQSGGYTKDDNAKLVGSYSGTETASSKEEWGSGTSGSGVARERVRRRTYQGNSELSNSNSFDLDFDGSTKRTNIRNSYYVLVYDFRLTVETGVASKTYGISSPKSYVAVVKGDGPTGVNPVGSSGAPWKTTTVSYTE
jgi:hypothetical protein